MIKVLMLPHVNDVNNKVGGIQRVVEAYFEHLPKFGVELVNKDAISYDLRVGHAGSFGAETDVETSHGIWWTADMENVRGTHWRTNRKVIDALRAAKEVTVPSAWVAHNIARDMHFLPHVVPHGIDANAWKHSFEPESYVLWNKGRDRDVCDPTPVSKLAALSESTQFVSTFCNNPPPNVKVIGRIPFTDMKPIIQRASVYLATTPETFGIGTLEAMASGVPVLGYNWKGTADIVTHLKDGYLVEPGDLDSLLTGLNHCIEHRHSMSAAAKSTAKTYTWQNACQIVANVYDLALNPTEISGVTVIIPAFNLSSKLSRAIQSVLSQTLPAHEIIVVDDGSSDNGATRKLVQQFSASQVKYIRQDNCGVAVARNHGISLAKTKYICCLDADDAIAPTFLSTLVPALDADPLLGVAYTGLLLVSPDLLHTEQRGWPPECDFNQQIKSRNQVPTCCVFRRTAWKQSGGYRQRYAPQGCGTEDAAFWLALGGNGWRMKRITNDPLFWYTVGGTTWNKSAYNKLSWTDWHPWTRDLIHPFASIATPDNKESHPVRQYDQPIVSVVIPVGPNHTSILVDALDSLEAQSFRLWEAIVVNDSGSPLDLTPWPYVTLIQTTGRKGAGFARNRGTEVSKGKYIIYLDADDFLQPRFISKTIDAIASYESTGHENTWIYTDMYIYRGSGDLEEYQCVEWSPEILWRKGIAPVTALYTKAMWEKVGGFDESLYREDWDFHLRLAMAGYCGVRIPEFLLSYRHSTGTRRRDGSHRKEINLLHKMYNREELIMACSSCGKRKPRKPSPATIPPTNWDTKENLGWPEYEFIGRNPNSIVFKNTPSGRRYLAGNNRHHRVIRIHPNDVSHFARFSYFRPYEAADREPLMAQSNPAPNQIPVAPPMPPPIETSPLKTLDIANLKVKDVWEFDFNGYDVGALIEAEESGKNRTTVLAFLARIKRKQNRETGR